MPGTTSFSLIWCAPTGTTTARSPETARPPRRSRSRAGTSEYDLDPQPAHQRVALSVAGIITPPRWRCLMICMTVTLWQVFWPRSRPAAGCQPESVEDPVCTQSRWATTQPRHPRPGNPASALRTEQLAAPAAVTTAFAATTRATVGIIAELNRQINDLEAELAHKFPVRPSRRPDLLLSARTRVVLGARVLGEFGDDPNRYTTAKCRKNYAGTSPLTVASGGNAPCWPAMSEIAASTTRSTNAYSARWQQPRPRRSTTAPRRRRPPPPSATSPRQPPRRHPGRLPAPPNPLRRTQSLGTPSNNPETRAARQPTNLGCLPGVGGIQVRA